MLSHDNVRSTRFIQLLCSNAVLFFQVVYIFVYISNVLFCWYQPRIHSVSTVCTFCPRGLWAQKKHLMLPLHVVFMKTFESCTSFVLLIYWNVVCDSWYGRRVTAAFRVSWLKLRRFLSAIYHWVTSPLRSWTYLFHWSMPSPSTLHSPMPWR